MSNVFRIYKLFFQGLNDTAHILGQVLNKFVASKLGWLKVLLIVIPISIVFLIAFNIIDLFIKAQDGASLTNFSQGMLEQILLLGSSNNGIDIITISLWGSTLAAFALPIVSNSLLSSYNRSSMIGIRKNDVHQITDSIVLQYSSILTIMQLVGMILFFGVIKYSFNLSSLVYLIPIALWLVFGLLTVFMAWFMDYLLRKYGSGIKFAFASFVGLLLLYMFFLLPEISKDYFGLASLIQLSFTENSYLFGILFVIAVIGLILIYGVMYFGLVTINTTAPFTTTKRNRKSKFVNSFMLACRTLLRNGNIKVPIIMMIAVILTSIISTGNSPTLFAFIFALPMVVTMSFMVNIYGVTGNGNSWLFSLKSFSSKSLIFFAGVNIAIIAAAVGFISLVANLLGILSLYDSLRFFIASIMAALIMTALATWYAIVQPNKYDVHIRGENILPPSKSLITLAVLILTGGLPAIYAFGFTTLPVLSAICLLTFVIAFIIIKLSSKKLKDGLTVNEIVAKTN